MAWSAASPQRAGPGSIRTVCMSGVGKRCCASNTGQCTESGDGNHKLLETQYHVVVLSQTQVCQIADAPRSPIQRSAGVNLGQDMRFTQCTSL